MKPAYASASWQLLVSFLRSPLRMASGEQAKEVSHLEAVYNKADILQNNAAAINPAVPVCPHVSMAEALAVAAAIELLLTIRNMLLNVKSNVRRPDLRSHMCPVLFVDALPARRCAPTAQ